MRYSLKAQKFCSHECSEEYHSGENHPKYVPKVKLNCKICGKEYEVIPYLADKLKTCRDPDCYKKWMSKINTGENHPLWQGGLSFEPYCPKFNNSFKERVRAYFNNRCVQCGTPQNGEKLHVHHVHYNKSSCCDPNVPKMFVPLCRSCHTKTNHGDRRDWREHFEQLLISHYGGRSYYTQEEWDELRGITPTPAT
jgi:ribosomal protein S14